MSSPDDTNGPADRLPGDPADPGDEATGLPWLKSWVSVYVFVTGCFVAWVVLLVVLELVYS
jgi:hypothetical protein